MDTAGSTSASASPPSSRKFYLCGTCNARFPSVELRRSHAKTEWHVYNVKCRVTGVDSVSEEVFEERARNHALSVAKRDEYSDEADSGEEDEDEDAAKASGNDDTVRAQPQFVQEDCLFCTNKASDFNDNLSHMLKMHGLFIPYVDRLAVDVETLVGYLHLIIFGYHECIYCGTQRRTSHAVRHHMVDNGHCKFDVAAEDSEYRDFYNFSALAEEGDKQEDDDQTEASSEPLAERLAQVSLQADGGTAQLPSGKTVANRTAPKIYQNRTPLSSTARGGGSATSGRINTNPSPLSSSAAVQEASTLPLTRHDKRDAVFTNQLARLRAADRQALLHLPTSQQVALLATQMKQVEKAKRKEKTWEARMEAKNNSVLMKHFVNDVPGRKLG